MFEVIFPRPLSECVLDKNTYTEELIKKNFTKIKSKLNILYKNNCTDYGAVISIIFKDDNLGFRIVQNGKIEMVYRTNDDTNLKKDKVLNKIKETFNKFYPGIFDSDSKMIV
jgi:hypothetical protein